MIDLTVLILTFNESENIARTLGALNWAARVIVLDSLSTDDTCHTVRSFGNVELKERRFDTHGSQWNAGLDLISTGWVLTLDADYIVTTKLADEIRALNPAVEIAGYSAAFRYILFGQPLRTSIYPPRVVLFRKEQARFFDEGHTQQLRLEGRVEPLQNAIWHDDRKSLNRWVASQNNYSVVEVRHLCSVEVQLLNKQDKLRKMIWVAPLIMPIYLLLGRGLILDGWRGWYYVFQRTIAEMLLSLRLLERRLTR
jgi:glycosyltransferase involved in cell wall biosynthesis